MFYIVSSYLLLNNLLLINHLNNKIFNPLIMELSEDPSDSLLNTSLDKIKKTSTNANILSSTFTLISSDEEEHENGEIKDNIIPFYKSYKNTTLYNYNNKKILIGFNKMPNIKYYITFNNRFKKELKKNYPQLSTGEELIEESRAYFNNHNFLNISETHCFSNLNITFIEEYEVNDTYNEFIYKLLSKKEICHEEDIYVKLNNEKYIIISDKFIDTYSRCKECFINFQVKNEHIIFDKLFFNGVYFEDYFNYLLNDNTYKTHKINETVGGLILKEKIIKNTIRKYLICNNNSNIHLLVYSNIISGELHGIKENRLFGNCIDLQSNAIKYINEMGKISLIRHQFNLFNTDLYSILVYYNKYFENEKIFSVNNGNLYEVTTYTGEKIAFKEINYSNFV